jgi:hypothetical protein
MFKFELISNFAETYLYSKHLEPCIEIIYPESQQQITTVRAERWYACKV